MHAAIELIPARIDGDGRLRYAVAREAWVSPTDPDATARAALVRMFPTLGLDRGVVHSTSWRFEHGGLTLTYLAYFDELSDAELPHLLPPDVRATADGTASVVAHAVRHLSFLIAQEPAKYRPALSPEALAFFAQIDPDVAGRIYRDDAA
jgi:hypothetical protein